jgi:hypothetical protein
LENCSTSLWPKPASLFRNHNTDSIRCSSCNFEKAKPTFNHITALLRFEPNTSTDLLYCGRTEELLEVVETVNRNLFARLLILEVFAFVEIPLTASTCEDALDGLNWDGNRLSLQ